MLIPASSFPTQIQCEGETQMGRKSVTEWAGKCQYI